MNFPDKIFIYGVPGAGKTTFSIQLAKKLGHPLIEADYLREEVAQKEKTEIEDPFAYIGTTEAFRKFGPLAEENVIGGLKAVRRSMAPYVAEEIFKHADSLILEAAFLDPHDVNAFGQLVLVVTSNEENHRRHYFEHREQNEKNREIFHAARMIQEYFLKEAEEFPVTVVENDGNIKEVIGRFNF